MKRLILLLMMSMFLVSFASAESLGTFKQSECIDLYQLCDSCSYVNITSVKLPNSTLININEAMDKSGVDYTYNFCNTSLLGEYQYSVCGDKSAFVCEEIGFEVTPSGSLMKDGDSLVLLGSLLVMIILSSVFLYIASYTENLTGRVTLYSVAFIGYLMSVLYSVVTVQQILFGFDSIINGIETFLFVGKIGVGIGFIVLMIIIFLIMLKAWKIKRGFDD